MTIKILLADDNKTFMAAVRRFLDRLPAVEVVAQSYDGREALARAEQLRPDLVLLDIAMPEMGGLDVARCMRSWPAPPLIVFLSMHDSPAYRAATHELGSAGFVSKADFVVELPPIIERLVAQGTKHGSSGYTRETDRKC